MTFNLGHANLQQTDRAADEARTIGTVADRSSVVTWNEARDAHIHLINLRGWFSVEAGGLAISWRFAELTKVDHGSKLVMRGGFVGADGVHTPKPGDDDRRVGPGRHVLWVVLDEKATGRRVILATHHAVAKKDTTAKWRRGIWAKGIAGVVAELRAVQKQYPGVPLILPGDFNAILPIVAFLTLGLREVKTPATFGRRRYDRVFATPSIVSGARAFATRSDHKALALKVTLGFVAPPPPPAPPKPPEEPVVTGLYPAATKRLIPPGSNDPAIKPRVAILHVDAGNADSLYDFFKNRSGGIESHFHIKKTGEVEQYRSIYRQADANLHANDFAVSIETQGFGAGEWNDAQLNSIKRLLLWLNSEAKIPLVKCPRWDGAGVGYHTLFGSPSHWTPVAKSCPGPDRIKQFHAVIVPWMKNASTPRPVEKPLNNVEEAHKLAGQALRLQAEANALLREVKDRPHVEKMLTKWTAGWHIIADAKAEGPEK